MTSMGKVELINNDISTINICRLSDSQLVGVDRSIPTMYTGNISWLESTGGDGTSFCQVTNSSMEYNDTILL